MGIREVKNQRIDQVYEYIHDLTNLSSEAVKQGYRVQYSDSDQRRLLINIVQNNKIVFENPGRIELNKERGQVLLLPNNWRS